MARRLSLSKHLQKSAKLPLIDQSPFAACTETKVVLYHVFIGMCSASFWRGAWYILDDVLFPKSKELSALSSLMLGTIGMLSVQGFFERVETYTFRLMNESSSMQRQMALSTRSIQRIHSVLRFTVVYSLVLSVVCVWRGTWMSWDIAYSKYYNEYSICGSEISKSTDAGTREVIIDSETIHASDPGHALRSGLMSHCTAVFMLCSLGVVASVFAPPAAISVIRDSTIFSTKTSIERLLYSNNYSRRTISANESIHKLNPCRRSKFERNWWRQRRNASLN